MAPVAAALVVLISSLPGLLTIPTLDRDEARFAQSTAQMLESGDFVNIRFQDQARAKKPAGINWLQALAVQLASSVERRQIWPYRIPSLASAMLAAAACAWGAGVFLGARGGLIAGVTLGASLLLSSEAMVGKTDATLCAGVTLSMAALAQVYGASRGVGRAGRATKALFWAGQALAIMVKGPVGPAIALMAMGSLWAVDREARWLRTLGWRWGLLFLAAMAGPWAMAITVSTDGDFWRGMIGGDIAPKLLSGRERHGLPPGTYAALLPLLFFPIAFLVPAALINGWRTRATPMARFALAWLLPAWMVLELAPTKLVNYPLPLFGALAWLAAAAAAQPLGLWTRRVGAALSLLAGVVLAAAALALAQRFDGVGGWAWATAGLSLATGAAGAFTVLRGPTTIGILGVTGLGVAAHLSLSVGLAPRLSDLWLSQRASDLLASNGLDPRNGVTPGPVVVVGYAEPSLIFALGTETDLAPPAEAAEALADGQPVLVEQRSAAAFRAALTREKIAAQSPGEVSGYDYSNGRPVRLTLWRLTPTTTVSGRGFDGSRGAGSTPGG